VFLQPGKPPIVRPARAQAGFDFPTVLQGSTARFNVYYQTDLGTDGQSLADSFLAKCESDYEAISGYFDGLTPAGLPFNIILAELSPGRDGSGGAYHYTCASVDIYCDVMTRPSLRIDRSRFLAAAEIVEVFSAAQGLGWDCGKSNGEGLSRVLATELY